MLSQRDVVSIFGNSNNITAHIRQCILSKQKIEIEDPKETLEQNKNIKQILEPHGVCLPAVIIKCICNDLIRNKNELLYWFLLL